MKLRARMKTIAITTLLGMLVGGPALAATRLGTEGNVYLANPYADPADGYFGFGLASGDFDGDGIDDLVVSELGTPARFRVLLGKSYPIGGPYPISRFTAKTVATPIYGSVLATGDFNGDGIDEVAIGDRYSSSNPGGGGVVYVYRRSAADSWTVQAIIRQGLGSYNGVDEAGDRFGFSLVSGDFDDDGFGDLAIGVPGQDHAGNPNVVSAGAVQVVYGSASGLSGERDRVFTSSNDGLDYDPDDSDQYGYALSAGDIDDDGDDDLAIGVPLRNCPNGGQRAGGVVILKGSTSLGLSTLEAQDFLPGQSGMLGNCDSRGYFGSALSIGKVNGQAYNGLALGVPLRNCPNGGQRAGGVVILKGSTSLGLSTLEAQDFLPGQSGMLGNCDSRGYFGSALSIGKVNGQAYNGLAIGAPLADVGGVEKTGAVHLMFGTAGGLTTGASKFITVTDLPGGVSIPFLQFGNKVKLGRLRTSTQSLAISSGRETVNGLLQAGALWVLHSGNGSAIISTSIVERLTASANLRIGPPAADESFGSSMAIGDFNGDGMNDLVIGANEHDDGGDANTGGGQIIYQSEFIFEDGFDGD